ncbi:esterase-like activity of phytase family protein [Rhodobacter sp. KR11]|uniref:esterase-like activity of phytase family protein n=1 Tax=Rhodobacter sp. KR11 TaxID=2974588 RepID=UPI0022236F88|nr:esterase-like activity of phytase family protein [Rhodobacter sp. KR11]MCW1918945.1 esterase-like activity of phytase family protein [Rhodobacter sp. KR11]
MRRRSLGQLILGLWLMGLQSAAGPLPPEGFLRSFDLKALPGGGFSALHMTADGASAVILTDKGGFLRVKIDRAAGQVTSGPLLAVLDAKGRPLRDGQSDTEGLAVGPGGRAWISTEGTARVLSMPRIGQPSTRMPRPKAFAQFPPNTAFEALARAPDGTLWLIPEAAVKGDLPVFTWTGTAWEKAYSLRHDPFWLVADACFDDKGRLYVLERLFAGPAGFASRIRRFDQGTEALILQTALGTHDNLEGLSIWRDGTGLVASMVSDDNFLKLFRAELVEYRLPD